MTKERLKTLLANALSYLEDETGEKIMGTDLEDEIGITQEEYDEIMETDCVIIIVDKKNKRR